MFFVLCSFFAPPKKERKKGVTALGNCYAPVTIATTCMFSLSVRTQFRCFAPLLLSPVFRYNERLLFKRIIRKSSIPAGPIPAPRLPMTTVFIVLSDHIPAKVSVKIAPDCMDMIGIVDGIVKFDKKGFPLNSVIMSLT